MQYKDVNILLVDDDKVDVLAVRDALESSKIANPVRVASDGVEALEILRGENGRQRLEYPYVVLLDLNMPRMNGIEFLKELRADERIQGTVVFVLTTSSADTDMIAAYKHHIAGYMVKSEVGRDFIHLIQLLKDFQISVRFPERPI